MCNTSRILVTPKSGYGYVTLESISSNGQFSDNMVTEPLQFKIPFFLN